METNLKNPKPGHSWLSEIEMKLTETRDDYLKDERHYENVVQTDNIAGLECTVERKVKMEGFSKKVLKQIASEQSVKSELKEKELSYVAILPTDIFRKLVALDKFYTFRGVDAEGNVSFNPVGLNKHINIPTNIIGFFQLIIGGIIGAYLGFLLMFDEPNLPTEDIIGGVIVCVLASIVGLLISFLFVVYTLPWYQKSLHRLALGARKRRTIAKSKLWPNYTDEDLGEMGKVEKLEELKKELEKTGNVLKAKLILPIPPADIAKTLVQYKQLQYKPYLVVHEDAFDFKVNDRLINSISSFLDPIVAYDFPDNVTVVAAQFGEIGTEKEKELIESIVEKFNTLKVDYLKEHLSKN